jgi:hypothetical protein
MKKIFMLSDFFGITYLTGWKIAFHFITRFAYNNHSRACKKVSPVIFTSLNQRTDNLSMQEYPATPFIYPFMKHLLFCLTMMCLTQVKAQTIKSDDFFKDDNQRSIQTADEPISQKDGITASVFFGTTESSNRVDTLLSIHFSVKVKKAITIEKGSMINLNFADGSTVSIPQQTTYTITANRALTPECYLDMDTWKKIMKVSLSEVVFTGSNPKLKINIPGSYQEVIPNMVKLLYEKGTTAFDDSL